MKNFLLSTNLFLAAYWLHQGVASGEESGRNRIHKTTDKFDKEIQESHSATLQGSVNDLLKNPEDESLDFGEEKKNILEAYYFFKGPMKITKNNQVQVITKPPTDYVLKFVIEPKGKVAGYSSIIHFTNKGDCCANGERVPFIAFIKNSTRLFVATSDTSSSNNQYPSESLEINKKSAVEVRVIGTVATVLINGVIKSKKNIASRPQLNYAKVYIGDPWRPAANAIISDLRFFGV